MLTTLRQILPKYLPAPAVEGISGWLEEKRVKLVITRNRVSKSGDYRPPKQSAPARIGINHSLNPYEFLITLVHEMAHHAAWIDEQEKVKGIFLRKRSKYRPHGKEWKSCFRQMMKPYLDPGIFPSDVLFYLDQFLENPKAATAADHELRFILKKYDTPDGSEFVEDLPYDTVFRMPGGNFFRKKEKLRKRYRCIRLDNDQVYLFSPAAQVFRA